MTEQAVVPIKSPWMSTINWAAVSMMVVTVAKLVGAPVDEGLVNTVITAGTGLAALYVWAKNTFGAARALSSQLPAK